MKNILLITSLLISTAVFGGPGLGSLLGGIDDAGTMHNSSGGTSIPVDGGLTIVVGASLWYGTKKINQFSNKKKK